MKPVFVVVQRDGLAEIARQMRQYAIANPIMDYDAFAAEARKPREGVVQQELPGGVIRSCGSVPEVMEPYTRYVSFKGAALQLLYLHVLDPKVQGGRRQLNVIDTWGFPLSFLLKEDGLEAVMSEFLNMEQATHFVPTPPHVMMAMQVMSPPEWHDERYPKKDSL